MAAPYWVTTAGDLGIIQEMEFYSLQLTARDPEQGTNNTGLTFTLLAGKMPGGVALAHTGLIDGIPTQRSLLKGVPYEVSENITSTFVVRVTDAETLIADRTFSLTVAGPDSPVFSTAAGGNRFRFRCVKLLYIFRYTTCWFNVRRGWCNNW